MTAKHPTGTRVHAIFKDSAVLFDLPENATLEQLATTLATVERGHGIAIRVEVSAKPASFRMAPHLYRL
jgi:hypothetical protein